MPKNWWGKLIFLLFVTVLSVVYVIPTVAGLNLETTKFPFKQKINLGLDLQGGLYMVLGVDFNKVYKDVLDRQESSLQSRLKDKNVSVQGIKIIRDGVPVDDPLIEVTFDQANREGVYGLIKKEYQYSLRMVTDTPGKIQLGLSHDYRTEVRDRTISQSIEVIRNRIDEFGVAEPSITSQGTDRVVVELPGVKDVERAKDLIGKTAKLEFKIVDDAAMPGSQLTALVSELEKTNNLTYKEGQKFSEYSDKINELAKAKLPEGKMIAF